MTNKDYDEFVAVLGMVYSIYDKSPNAPALVMWWNLLKKQELNTLKIAFERHLSNPDNGQYLPKPADILRLLEGSSLDLGLLAWTKVDKAIREVGTYQDVVFDDHIIHAVIHDMGGWIALGSKNEDEWPFVGKEFQTRYRGYKTRGVGEYPKVLTGIANAQNRVAGQPLLPPKLLGIKEQSLALLNKNIDKNILQGIR